MLKKFQLKKENKILMKNYWGKPVTGFGDIDAKLLILGIAPAAHGGTRTGRAFTGDKSGEFYFNVYIKLKLLINPFQKI